jgi:alpha-amylase/alpha-mannosidase (GH57 family)
VLENLINSKGETISPGGTGEISVMPRPSKKVAQQTDFAGQFNNHNQQANSDLDEQIKRIEMQNKLLEQQVLLSTLNSGKPVAANNVAHAPVPVFNNLPVNAAPINRQVIQNHIEPDADNNKAPNELQRQYDLEQSANSFKQEEVDEDEEYYQEEAQPELSVDNSNHQFSRLDILMREKQAADERSNHLMREIVKEYYKDSIPAILEAFYEVNETSSVVVFLSPEEIEIFDLVDPENDSSSFISRNSGTEMLLNRNKK